MKKFITLLISGSLTLAAAAIAQQPGDEQSQDQHTKKSKKNQTEQTQSAAGSANEAKPGKAERRAAKKAARQEKAGMNANATGETNANANTETGASTSPRMGKEGKRKNRRENKMNADASAASPEASASANTNAGENANANVNEKGKGKGKRGRKVENEGAAGNASASAAPSASVAANAETTTNARVAGGGGGKIRGHGKGGKKLDENIVQKVKSEHTSFKAQPRPDKAPAVSFNANFRFQGAERWEGPKYKVYRSYRPERHDRNWYHSHHNRIELIAGGYYYWNDGYWFPAWGYDSGHEYYAYDAPIYVGHRAEPPDRVIADVQAILQDAGYYEGEVDGLLGPLTRQALTDYQADNGLYQTAVIDEPTLDSLGLS